MLTVRIIPCLDVSDGRVVKGVRFQNLRDSGDPAELAQVYADQGADELVLLDISATPQGRKNQTQTVEKVRKVISIPLTVGGGVRSIDDAQALLLAGADKVSVNTAAVENPQLIHDIAQKFGSQCSILAIDAVRAGSAWRVVIRSGKEQTKLDVAQWAKKAEQVGAGEVLLTSFDRDGTRMGYDLDLLREVSSVVNLPIIASGGASTPEHLCEALEAGAQAVLAASIFHEAQFTVSELKSYLRKKGVSVRL